MRERGVSHLSDYEGKRDIDTAVIIAYERSDALKTDLERDDGTFQWREDNFKSPAKSLTLNRFPREREGLWGGREAGAVRADPRHGEAVPLRRLLAHAHLLARQGQEVGDE